MANEPVSLLFGDEETKVAIQKLVSTCEAAFKPGCEILTHHRYVVKSQVSKASWRVFLSFIIGEPISIPDVNALEVRKLAIEFGCTDLVTLLDQYESDCKIPELESDMNRDKSLEILVSIVKAMKGEIAELRRRSEEARRIMKTNEKLARQVTEMRQELDDLRRENEALQLGQSPATLPVLPSALERAILKHLSDFCSKDSRTHPKAIDRDVSSPGYNGVIARLTKECKCNVVDANIVGVFSTGCEGKAYEAKNIADFGSFSYFKSGKNGAMPYVGYDFKKLTITPRAYALRTYGAPPGSDHLQSWTVEISDDGRSWQEIDRQGPCSDLNDHRRTKTYRLPENCPKCRCIRIHQTGKNHNGQNILILEAFEVYETAT